jgi:hypothetical protein
MLNSKRGGRVRNSLLCLRQRWGSPLETSEPGSTVASTGSHHAQSRAVMVSLQFRDSEIFRHSLRPLQSFSRPRTPPGHIMPWCLSSTSTCTSTPSTMGLSPASSGSPVAHSRSHRSLRVPVAVGKWSCACGYGCRERLDRGDHDRRRRTVAPAWVQHDVGR